MWRWRVTVRAAERTVAVIYSYAEDRAAATVEALERAATTTGANVAELAAETGRV